MRLVLQRDHDLVLIYLVCGVQEKLGDHAPEQWVGYLGVMSLLLVAWSAQVVRLLRGRLVRG